MKSILEGLRTLEGRWQVKETRYLTDKEVSLVDTVMCVQGEYGPVLEFRMKNGYISHLPLGCFAEEKYPMGQYVAKRRVEIAILYQTVTPYSQEVQYIYRAV